MYSLAKRWWHTTHTFHIVDREMTVTPYNFHQMTSLRYDGSFINLEGELGTALRIELLGWGYMMDTICYFDIETNYRPLPQKTPRTAPKWLGHSYCIYWGHISSPMEGKQYP